MNYLAHLHIAKITNTSYVGNLLGDFVKGSVDSLVYNEDIKQGIKLHRAVDTFTDKHPFTRDLKQSLGQYRRYGGIVLDVFYDHQLALQFDNSNQSNSLDLFSFSQKAYQELDLTTLMQQGYLFPERFVRVVKAMTEMDWLTGYSDIDNIERALMGISHRLKRPVDLTQILPWYETHFNEINLGFLSFYQELVSYAQENK